jgi:hypothetical protein
MNDVQGESTQDRKNFWQWVFLPSAVMVLAAFNAVFDPAEQSSSGGFSSTDVLLAGMAAALPGVFGTYAALRPPPIAIPILTSLIALSVVLIARPVVEWWFAVPSLRTKYFDATMLVIFWFEFAIAVIVVAILRAVFRFRLVNPAWLESAETSRARLSLRALILLMTLAAIVLAMLRGIGVFARAPDNESWREIAASAYFSCQLATPLVLPIPLVAFAGLSSRFPKWELLIGFLALVGLSAYGYWAVFEAVGFPGQDVWPRILTIQAGAIVLSAMTVAVLRLAGFRLVRIRRAPSTTSPPEPVH